MNCNKSIQSFAQRAPRAQRGVCMRISYSFFFLLLSFVLNAQNIGSRFAIANTLQSNMVIQQQKPLVIWGFAKPGTKVQVKTSWQNQSVNTETAKDGKWTTSIPVPEAQPGNFTPQFITVTAGSESKTLFNILIGDVWLCSGQSNMDMELKPFLPWLLGAMHFEMEIENANYPQIRLFNVRTDFTAQPQDDCGGKWMVCSPATAPDFSALAYFFAREIYNRRNIPVGLVVSSVGGSSCQAWVSRDTLQKDEQLFAKYLQPYDTSKYAKEPLDSVVTFEKVVRPTLFYNAMIHPLKNLQFKGALWYQGESNRYDSSMYTRLFSSMIRNWRDLFKNGDLPFYFVQLAPYNWQQKDTTVYEYALLREAQSKTRDIVHNTEMALTMDIADPTDIHPRNKQDLGYRLAKIALANVYGNKDVVHKGPEYDGHTVTDSIVKVRFKHIGSGLGTNDGLAPKHFYVAGKDGKFHYANAFIEKDEVWLYSEKVKEPVSVRYAFTNFPETNFQNKNGFPAVPFRSDF